MNKEKILSFLILDWKNFQKNTLKILEKKSSKKSEFFNNFRTRIMEQIVNFIRLNHQIYSKNFFFFCLYMVTLFHFQHIFKIWHLINQG